MPIKVLNSRVVAQIAAGEVVERPASVVKELVENSLDAGSTQITVETRSGGVDLLRVTDNGCGIPSAEVGIAFKRHATSKINNIEDLNSVVTLGFRGEALSSIAATAEVELLTCTSEDKTGTFIKLIDNVIQDRISQARSPGTTVTVRYLFRKIPARLKFLKSNNTEDGRIANVVTQYALAYPEVRFHLIQNNKNIIQSPGNGRLLDCMIKIYGAVVAGDMLEVGSQETQWNAGNINTIQVAGLVGAPKIARTSRSYLSFFINRRWVNSRLLSRAVEEAYQGLLMQGRHPVAVLNITLSPAEVDINVHPTKTEVKFKSDGTVFTAVQKAIRRTLIQQAPIPKIEDITAKYTAVVNGKQSEWNMGLPPATSSNSQPTTDTTSIKDDFSSLHILRVIGQIAGNYIIAEGSDGMYIIDQHAAHERIRYEQICQQRRRSGIEVQGLLEPLTFEIGPVQYAVMKRHYNELIEFGFSLEPFGERTFLVRTVPAILFDGNWEEVLREIIDSYNSGDRAKWEERIIDSMACHSAVRAGQTLTEMEMRELMRQLEQTEMPHTCPHGRPTMLHLTKNQLEKEFGRTG